MTRYIKVSSINEDFYKCIEVIYETKRTQKIPKRSNEDKRDIKLKNS